MARFDVVTSDELFGQLNDFTLGVGFGVPPSIFVEGAEGVHQHRLTVLAQCKLFLSVHMDKARFCGFALDDIIDLDHDV